MTAKYKVYEVAFEDEDPEVYTNPTKSTVELIDEYENTNTNCCQSIFNKNKDSGTSIKMNKVIKILVLGPGKLNKIIWKKKINNCCK